MSAHTKANDYNILSGQRNTRRPTEQHPKYGRAIKKPGPKYYNIIIFGFNSRGETRTEYIK